MAHARVLPEGTGVQASLLRKFDNIRKNVFEESVSVCVFRDRWCNTIVLNVHAPSEEKHYESKDSV
jgi:hypothetical protein